MKTKSPSKRIQETAYHEAGHTVLALRLGLTFDSVTIVANDEYAGAILGLTSEPYEMEDEVSDQVMKFKIKDPQFQDSLIQTLYENYLRNRIQMIMAGPLTAKKLTGSYSHQGAGVKGSGKNRYLAHGSDYDQTISYAEVLLGSRKSLTESCRDKLLDFLWLETETLIELPEVWEPIQAIAKKLLESESISYKEAKVIYEDSKLEAQEAKYPLELRQGILEGT